jgi:hypothetical protein
MPGLVPGIFILRVLSAGHQPRKALGGADLRLVKKTGTIPAYRKLPRRG